MCRVLAQRQVNVSSVGSDRLMCRVGSDRLMCQVLAQRQVNVSSVGSETDYCVECWLRDRLMCQVLAQRQVTG